MKKRAPYKWPSRHCLHYSPKRHRAKVRKVTAQMAGRDISPEAIEALALSLL